MPEPAWREPDWRSDDGTVQLWHADARLWLPTLGRIECVVTDPPYGMAFQSNHRQEEHAAIAGDDGVELLRLAVEYALEATHSGYVFCRWDNLQDVQRRPKSLITWVKNNWSMGDLDHEHARQTESILFWPGPQHRWGNGRPTDVVFAPRTDNELHPTQKSVELMDQVVSWSEGRIVEPFMGSGATIVSAIRAGREVWGCELNREYFETARDRAIEAKKAYDTLWGAKKSEPPVERRHQELLFA